jgi:hypothetical protein
MKPFRPEPPPPIDELYLLDPIPEAIAAVQLGLWTSATRCVLTYVVAPAAGVLGIFLGPSGLILQVLGAITSTYGARNLWALGHRHRHRYAFIALAVNTVALLTLGQSMRGLLR